MMDENKYNEICKNIEKEKGYIMKNNTLYKIKNNEELKVIKNYEFEGIMYIAHDHELSGHFGIDATYDRIKNKYYWKGMRKDIEAYVKSCNNCQRRGKPIGKHELNVIKVKEPFYQMGIDIIGPLKITERNNRYIVTAMDYFTKWPEARALEKADAKEVARFIYEDIICRHGCPKKILSDRGSHFNNKLIKSLMEEFQIKHNFSTPYHPKTNGLIERFNKTL